MNRKLNYFLLALSILLLILQIYNCDFQHWSNGNYWNFVTSICLVLAFGFRLRTKKDKQE